MRLATSAVVFVALAAAGCNKKSEPPPPLPTAAESVPAAPAPTPAPTPVTTALAPENDAVPTEEDYEEEAQRGINAGNLEAELDKLEREIGQ